MLNDESFTNIDHVGGGSYGQVYRSVLVKTSEVFAVKRVPKKNVKKSFEYDQLLLELKVGRKAATSKSNNMVALLASYATDSCLVLVMKLFSYGSIQDLLDKGRIPRKQNIIRYWAAQAIAGLSELHSWYYIHRDVKPENLLLCEDGRAKLADFGLVMKVEFPGAIKQYAGTPAYSAPEVAIEKIPQYESDFYSLGMTFFHILTGNLPYQVCSNIDDSAFAGIFEKNSGITIDWDLITLAQDEKDFLKCALNKNPDKRKQMVLKNSEYFRGVNFENSHLHPSFDVENAVKESADQPTDKKKASDGEEPANLGETNNKFPFVSKYSCDFADEIKIAKDFYYSSIGN